MTTDLQPYELPETFSRQGERIVSPGGTVFLTVWNVRSARPTLSYGERQKLEAQTGTCYLTGKSGRLGWNVRASFPKDWIKRGLPFIYQDSSGMLWHFSRYGQVLKATA